MKCYMAAQLLKLCMDVLTGKGKYRYCLRVGTFGTESAVEKTWWQQEFAVFKCEATANSVTGHVCVNSNKISEIRKKKALLLLNEIG